MVAKQMPQDAQILSARGKTPVKMCLNPSFSFHLLQYYLQYRGNEEIK